MGRILVRSRATGRVLAATVAMVIVMGATLGVATPAGALQPSFLALFESPTNPETVQDVYAGEQLTLVAVIGAFSEPTGTVTFRYGTTVIGTVPVENRAAAIRWRPHVVGQFKVVARYSGDVDVAASTSSSLLMNVRKIPTECHLIWQYESNPVSGQPSTWWGVPTNASTVRSDLSPVGGTVTFRYGARTVASATVGADGTARATFGNPMSGDLTCVYSGGPYWLPSVSDPTTVTVDPAPVSAALAVSTLVPSLGEPVTFTETVWPSGGSVRTPTGLVRFLSGDTVLATRRLVRGVATFTTTRLPAGPVSVSSTYAGNARTLAAAVPVAKLGATSTLDADVNPVPAGSPLTLHARVASSGATGVPTGTVTFSDGATELASAPLVDGDATTTVAMTGDGSHRLTARYSGDAEFALAVSDPLAETVTPGAADATVTQLYPITGAALGTQCCMTAYVTSVADPANTHLNGVVTFREGAVVVDSVPLVSNYAGMSLAGLGVGSHSIVATYSGSPTLAGSTSAAASADVAPGAIAVTVTSDRNPVHAGDVITFHATVDPWNPANPVATGTVDLLDGASVLASAVPVVHGVAVFATPALAPGSHSIVASYSGDPNYAAQPSDPLVQVVDGPAG